MTIHRTFTRSTGGASAKAQGYSAPWCQAPKPQREDSLSRSKFLIVQLLPACHLSQKHKPQKPIADSG
jgi:hypothetical protein